jgi:hypothetical protein
MYIQGQVLTFLQNQKSFLPVNMCNFDVRNTTLYINITVYLMRSIEVPTYWLENKQNIIL